MKKAAIAILSALLLAAAMVGVMVANPLPLRAAGATGSRVVDDAYLYTDGQLRELEALARDTIARTGVDFVVITTMGFDGLNQYNFADRYFETYGRAVPRADGAVLMILDMQGREVYVMGTGAVEKLFNNTRFLNKHLDKLYDELAAGRYFAAAKLFLQDSGDHVFTKTHPWRARLQPVYILLCLAAGLVVGAIVAGIMLLRHRNSLPKAPPAQSYYGKEGVAVTHTADIFVGTHTTRRAIPQQTSSGGGGGGGGGSSGGSSFSGRSSGGNSYSGGSRKF